MLGRSVDSGNQHRFIIWHRNGFLGVDLDRKLIGVLAKRTAAWIIMVGSLAVFGKRRDTDAAGR